MTDTTDKLIIQAETQGVQQSTDQLNQLGKSMDGVTVASDKVEKSTVSLDSKFQGLERRFGTTAGQAQQFAKIQDTVNKAVAQNPELQDRANALLDAAKIRYGQVADAEKALGDAHAGLSGQAQALQHAFRSTVDSLASGAPVTQVLGQEFGRLSYVMSGQGGLSGAFGELKGTFGSMLTPMRLVAGGALGIGAAALYVANSWSEARDQINLALIGISQRTGTSETDIANFAKANATATGISIADARNVALEFTKTGNVAVAGLKNVGEAIHGYSLLTGKDATEATKDFVEAINTGLPGFEKLDARYGALTASTTQYIQALIASGDKTAALQVYMNATADANKRAEESVGSLAKAWQNFKNVIGNVLAGPAPTSPQEQLDALRAQRAQAASTNAVGTTPGGYLNTAAAFGGKSQELAEFDKLIAAAQEKLDKFSTQTATSQLDALSKAAQGDVNAILPQIKAIDDLNAKLKELQAAKDSVSVGGDAPGNTDAALAVYQRQRDLQQESLDTTIRQAQVVNQLKADYGGVSTQTALTLQNLELQLSVATSLTAASQQKAQAEATYEQLLTQGVKATEAEAIAMGQLKLAQEQATTSVLKQVDALKDSTAMIHAHQNGTEATTAAAIAYKNAINSGADATAAAALKAATLANYLAQGAANAQQLANAYQGMLSIAGSPTTFSTLGVPYAPNYSIPGGPGFTETFDAGWGGGTARALGGTGALDNFGSLGGTGALDNFYSGGGSGALLDGGSATTAKTDALKTSIDKLTTSTNDLNKTNGELLSPYYTQDPRTSHIGFRSQGMAGGGYVDVPGAPSANDNMLALIPVASGERISVDPMPSRRGGSGGGSQTINISMPITIIGNANKDEVGRTVYQTMQTASKRMAASQR